MVRSYTECLSCIKKASAAFAAASEKGKLDPWSKDSLILYWCCLCVHTFCVVRLSLNDYVLQGSRSFARESIVRMIKCVD